MHRFPALALVLLGLASFKAQAHAHLLEAHAC